MAIQIPGNYGAVVGVPVANHTKRAAVRQWCICTPLQVVCVACGSGEARYIQDRVQGQSQGKPMTASLSHPRAPQRTLHALPSGVAAAGAAAALRTQALRLVPQPEGLLQVHTAPFRGSVASVLSQALRSAGLGSRVLISQFLKGGVEQGPERMPTLCGRLQWLRPAIEVCIDAPLPAADLAAPALPDSEQCQAIVEVWELCRTQLLGAGVDLMVLDELGLAVHYGYLDLDDVLLTLQQRPAQMDVILTGPAIPEPLMAMADQVTQLRRGL